jgi:hypothetical protein
MTGLQNLEIGKLFQPGFEHQPIQGVAQSLYQLSYTGPITILWDRDCILFYLPQTHKFLSIFPRKEYERTL